MNAGRALWVLGAYLAGTLPSAWLVARARSAGDVFREADRSRSEGDAHVLLKERSGGAWAAVAATADVLKAFGYALAARFVGDLPPAWLAPVGVLLVAGHSFPPYARAFAGRGLAAAAGATLALVPWAMVAAGVTILAGYPLGLTGPASTAAFALMPAVVLALGDPPALALMAAGILAVILLRRVEGSGRLVARVGLSRALLYRMVFDRDGPPLRG
ncbi:MAG: glycerol-3-phosphate acyltransferase [Actinobacteria bacterium]|nr:glycerol-3-phosphate acyltransferase [Actinomycetota bacterium]